MKKFGSRKKYQNEFVYIKVHTSNMLTNDYDRKNNSTPKTIG